MPCDLCGERGFVMYEEAVAPCPRCNPDSGFEPGEYQAELVKRFGRCADPTHGGGRTCYLPKGHTGPHYFECGK